MSLDDYRQSLASAHPPAGLPLVLAGLWWDAKRDGTQAHESALQDEGPEGSWVHAYLHRKEDDQGNAAYWYSRAAKPVCREPLDADWHSRREFLLMRDDSRQGPLHIDSIVKQKKRRWRDGSVRNV